jgi:hypothetical protein
MTLDQQYEEALAAWHTARSQMLSDRLTLSRKEAQMHEADVEQDDSVADYFASRRAEMARRVAADEERLAALAANAEELRIAMVTEELHATILSYEAALRALESRLAELQEQAAQVALLTRRATELAETLPASATKQREGAARLAARTETIQAAVQYLEAALSESGM